MSNQSKHTFTLAKKQDNMFGHQVILDADSDECGTIVHQGHDIDIARLIAAAPELLEACKLVAKLGWDRMTPARHEAVSAVRAAIAKAEGRQ